MSKPIDPLALNAGDLRYSIAIQSRSTTPDSFGQPVTTWTTIRNTRAAIERSSGNELAQSGDLASQQIYTIKMYWNSIPVGPGMRVVSGADSYHVQGVENVQKRNRVLKLTCLEIDGIE
jgi:SPP1 family predicted phage head-tail adaptor